MTKPKPKATKAQLVASQRRLIKAVNLLSDQIREQRLAIDALTKLVKPVEAVDWKQGTTLSPMSQEAIDAYAKSLNRVGWR